MLVIYVGFSFNHGDRNNKKSESSIVLVQSAFEGKWCLVDFICALLSCGTNFCGKMCDIHIVLALSHQQLLLSKIAELFMLHQQSALEY